MTSRSEQSNGRSGGVVPLRPKSSDAPTSMQVQVMDVSPALAQEFLNALAPYQRNLDTRHVAHLEADMKAGRWVPNGTPIRFDSNGQLCDGQHRLTACVLAGVTLYQQVIVYALPVEANATIDTTAKPRSAIQLARARNKFAITPNTSTLAAIALEHYNFETWKMKETCTAMERAQLWEQLPVDWQDKMRKLENVSRAKRITHRGALAAAFRLMKGDPPNESFAYDFCSQAFSNHVDASHAARVLFNTLTQARGRGDSELDYAWFVMRAFIAHSRNERIQLLRPPAEWPVELRNVRAITQRIGPPPRERQR